MHDMQHTSRHMICMMCKLLREHGQHKINHLAKSRSSNQNKLDTNNLRKYLTSSNYFLVEITKDLGKCPK